MNLLVRTCDYGRMNVSRLIARGVVLGWVIAGAMAVIGSFAKIGYTAQTPTSYAMTAAVPLVIGLVIFIVGFFFEVLAALMAAVVALALLAWGFVAAWEPAQWIWMIVVVIVPLALAGFLYVLASQTQKVCELEEAAS